MNLESLILGITHRIESLSARETTLLKSLTVIIPAAVAIR